MDDMSTRILARLYPDVFPAVGAGWRERRSAETRIALLEATIDCLQRVGYANTSNRTIAERAGISHGTIGHHYATQLDLIAAAIDYAFYKRMEIFIADVMKLTETERVDEVTGAELYWQSLNTREYAACLELEIASRSDQELKKIYLPRARRFDQIWREEMVRIFPEWRNKGDLYTLVTDFGWALQEGLMLKYEIWDSKERLDRVRALERMVIRMLRTGELTAPAPAAEKPGSGRRSRKR
jgi:AcrR family transcriptional regulator